jgi:hypothetical protein
MFGIMAAFGALLVAGGRSESLRTLRGDTDERGRFIDRRATALAGLAVALAAIVGCVVRLAQGNTDPGVYGLFAAVFGLSYLAALLWLHRRS